MKKFYLMIFILLGGVSITTQAQKPIELLQEINGMTAADYYRLSQEANRFYQQQNLAKAIEAYEKLTKAYPYDGAKWRRLALSLSRAGRFQEAIEPFLKAYEFGNTPNSQYNVLNLAESYARTGDNENALLWLGKLVGQFRFNQKPTLLKNPAFASLKDNPRFVKLVEPPVKPRFKREEGWRADIDYLLSEIKRLNPVYSKQPLPGEILQAANQLKRQIPKLSDAQVLFEMQHLLALLKQSHNGLDFDEPGKLVKLTQLPMVFEAFPEGLYIVDALQPYENLIGARVLQFHNTTAERALEATGYVVPRENEMAVNWSGPDFLKFVQLLYTLKLTSNPDCVNLTVIDREGKTRVVTPEPVPVSKKYQKPKLKAPRLPNLPPSPLYLSRPDDKYWFEYLEKDKTIYVQYNQVSDKQNDESLAQFGLRLRDFIAKNEVHNLVVDVRRNNGGSTFVDAELLRTIIEFDAKRDNRLFVITGRNTFSAASNFITDVNRLTNAVFVGEPSSSTPLMIGGDEAILVLPYSGVLGFIASTTWALTAPRDTRLWIPPDIPVTLTAKDYFINRDLALETVFTLTGNEEKNRRNE
jgi:tetratricopeptide (TPR) repeat protein